MTHEQFRTGLSAEHTSAITAAVQSGHSLKVANLSRQIEDELRASYGRSSDARDYANDGNAAMAALCHRNATRHLIAAPALIALPEGRAAYELYQERTR